MRIRSLLLIVLSVSLAAPAARAVVDPATPLGVVTGLNGPESAVWDPATGAWYISVGAFSGDGGVVKLLPGADAAEPFLTGLNGPQGVTIHDGTMYVADVDRVVVADMDDPGAATSIATGGGANDLDVDPDTGDLFVSDLAGGVVWRIDDGVSSSFAEINSPDGLYVLDGGVYIANFALGGPGGIFRFDIATGERSTVSDIPLATLDGLEPDGEDWLTTDFTKGHLWRVAPDGSLTVIAQLLPGSADIGLDPAQRILAVPNLLLNNVVFLQV